MRQGEGEFAHGQRDSKGAGAGAKALDHNNFKRIFGGKLFCAVIFKPPENAGEQDQQRTCGEGQAADIFHREQDARGGL